MESTRREFLGSTGAALVLGFTLPLQSGRGLAAAPVSAAPFAPNAWLRIGADHQVTVICGSAEMGQGVLTAIPMMVAEELDADWRDVRVEQAPADQAYINPAFGIQATGGSSTVRGHWQVVRQAGAAARLMLVAAAAETWQTTPDRCRTEAGQVVHADGRRLRYGELVARAAKQPVPDKPALKDPKDFRLMGRPLKRLDSPDKVMGKAQYGLDVQVPGLLVAVMARAPLPGVKVRQVDDHAARAVKGVKQVISLPSGVAVLATGYWAAKTGRDALKIDWDFGDKAALSSTQISAALHDAAAQGMTGGAVARTAGTPDQVKPATLLDAVYEVPYLAHACMEPMNCTAWVREGEVEIWAGTQSQGPVQGILGQVASVQPGKVKVNTMMLGGGFGRRFAPDFVIDATLLSKISGAPVKLIFSREDDMAAGYFRPASVVQLRGGLDDKGRPVLLQAGVATPSIMAASGFMKLPPSGVDVQAVEGLADHVYDIPHQRMAYVRQEPGPQVWFWRSVGHSQNSFFLESFIDEMAHAAKQDPYAFRRSLLSGSPRHLGVLDLAAKRANWGTPLPAGRHRGIAVVQSFGTYVAEVAEVSVAADGTPKVHRVVAAVDCGQTVNPEIIRRQIEGAIVFGLSAALYGQISYQDGRVQQSNFHDYPVLRMSEMPVVEVHIVPSMEAPGGIGEPGTPPLAPAVANALFAATGRRLRKLPFDTQALKKA
ncbi:MAG: xanthine dehydrogenase family protein molybdopterin-binding subunit [Burkholderiaceae bacterium]|nr:xanthine dehydrogenase family protein molybdopterin-binding subunit [Burkholderiaceae bacterium]